MRNGNPGKCMFATAALALAAALCLAGGSLALAEAGVALAGGGQTTSVGAASVTAGGADGALRTASALDAFDEDADDGETNEEGATITDDQGIVYTVTAVATADEPGEAELTDGSELTVADATVGTVTQQVGGVNYAYAIDTVAAEAFRGNVTLESIVFEEDLTGAERDAVGDYSFAECTSLVRVEFPSKTCCIGDYAFYGCTSLVEVVFPEDAELYTTSTSMTAIVGPHAFSGCTALTTFSVPAITAATRVADAYFTFEEYNAGAYLDATLNGTSFCFYSGYQDYWHGGTVPVSRAGLSDHVFSGCSALESLVFEAGAPLGAYAYLGRVTPFDGCDSLQAIVCEDLQPYYLDPNGSMQNQSFTDLLSSLDEDPTLYYAVDFYATSDASAAEDDDTRASGRYARVELARGAPTDAVKTGDAEALAAYLADADLYAEDGYADGEVPDPDEVAASLGYDTSVQWAWKLTGSQSQREGLTESCSAYLVEASDLSAGRLYTPVASALQKRCDQNFSRWIFDLDGDGDAEECDSTFDPVRWYGSGTAYDFTTEDPSDDPVSEFYVVITSDGEDSLLEALTLHDALGDEVDLSECTVKYRRWASGALSTATKFSTALDRLGDEGGPLMVVVTPGEGTGLDESTSLYTWVLVAPNSGSVYESYTDSAASTFTQARAYVNHRFQISDLTYDAPYAVGVSSADLSSAAVAAGVAGMAGASVQALDEEDEGYGMTLWTGLGSGATIMNGSELTKTYPSASYSPSAYAAAVYQALGSARSALGAGEEDYPWGDAAVLACAGDVEGTAAAAAAWAYANAAPVLYAEADGSVSEATLECLEDFGRVVVVADESDLSEEALAALAAQAAVWGATVERVAGDAGSACSLSLAVAEDLIEDGLASPYIACVTDAVDSADAIVALSLAGHEGGVSLLAASTADAKEVCSWLRERRDYVAYVRLFGRGDSRTSSEDFDIYDTLCLLWDEDAWEELAVEGGDTLALHGASFDVGSDGSSLAYASDLWAHATIAAGTYTRAGASYTLASDAAATNAAAVEGASASGGAVALAGEAEAIAAWAAAVTCVSVDGAASSEVTVASDGTIAVSALADGGHSVVVYAAGYDAVQLAVTVSSGQATSAALGALEEEASSAEDASSDDASSAGSGSSTSSASSKKAQGIKVKARKAVTVKYSKLKRKAQGVKASKLCKVTGAKGTLTYSKVSVKRNGKKASKKLAKKIAVSKAGKVTLKKGLAKGTYKVKLKVRAAATSKYKASAAKTVTVTIKVK